MGVSIAAKMFHDQLHLRSNLMNDGSFNIETTIKMIGSVMLDEMLNEQKTKRPRPAGRSFNTRMYDVSK